MSVEDTATGKRMGNPRTIPLRREDLSNEECLIKFIFPRLLDIVNQTEASESEFQTLINKFIVYWREEKDKAVEKAKEVILTEFKNLSKEEIQNVLNLIDGLKDQED